MTVAAMEAKNCTVCGRRFSWRRKWQRAWDGVRYCSERCRERRLLPSDYRLEKAIEHLLSTDASGVRRSTIEPVEAARLVDPVGWGSLLEAARMAARRLAAAGRLEFLQGGRVVDPSTAKGRVLLRRSSLG